MTVAMPAFGVVGPERSELQLPDGVVLVADVWRPESPGQFPVLLMRQPYGRTIASTVVFAHPAWYAAHGYVVVIQDVRGCGDSGGTFAALINEAADGAASLDWAAGLPFSNGHIGLYGFSYQGVTQYLALAGGGRRPDAMAPAMAPWSTRNNWAFEGNAFRFASNVGWAVQMAWLRASRDGDHEMASQLRNDISAERLAEMLSERPDFSHLSAWREDAPDYWSQISPDQLLANDPLDIPVMHLGGWYDYMLGGTLAADAAFRAARPDTSHLVIGPWTHIPWNRSAGNSDMGPAAEYSVDRAQLRFFDFYLKGIGERPGTVELFDVGKRHWVHFDRKPEVPAVPFYLRSSGLAATLLTDGGLTPEPPLRGIDRLVHDPSNPTPLVGGHLGTPQGLVDRARIDDRADVAVYTTPIFGSEVLVCGKVVLHLNCEASFPRFDIGATLSLVSPDGVALVLRTAFTRCTSSGPRLLAICLQDVLVTVPAGSSLRLSLQGGGSPAFEVARAEVPSGQPRPILITIRHGGSEPSWLELPMRVEPVAS